MITLTNVTAIYKSNKICTTALNNISLSFCDDSTTAVMGKSGSGKTTLLKVIGTLLLPESGTVSIDGTDIYSISETDRSIFRRTQIGFIYQSYDLLPELNAYENIAIAEMINNRKPNKDNIMEICDQLGVSGLLSKYPAELSGGEQQRIAIARAISTSAKIILCDEPTGNLDEENSSKIIDYIIDITKTRHLTTIIVTHDKDIAGKADRIIHLRDGRIAE